LRRAEPTTSDSSPGQIIDRRVRVLQCYIHIELAGREDGGLGTECHVRQTQMPPRRSPSV
jgi:hypothetical protein